MWGRIANYASFILLSLLPAMRTKADVIVAMTDPPVVVLPAVVVGKIKCTPVLYWLQDYLPEFLIGTGQARDRGAVRFWSLAHHAAAKRCSSVVAIGRDMADRLTAAGVPRDLICVVPNGSALDWDDIEDHPRDAVPRELVVLHAGEIGMRGAWETMVDGARELAGVANLVFLGNGVRAHEVRRLASGLPNVTFRPAVPSGEVRGALLDADVLVVTIRRGAEGYTVPSKTYELFGAGKPVLVVGDETTESALLVKEIGCGFVVSPDDPSGFTTAVQTLAADEALRSKMGAAARSASAGFARASMMQRIVDQAEMLACAT
jgi:glycosyltransferase involved in cell wall biosynthesis